MPDRGADGSRVEDLRWIHRRAEDFEEAWRAGRGPGIEDYLAGAEGPRRTALLKELLQLEWELRRTRGGERPEPREYAARFPELAGWILQTAPGSTEPGPDQQATISSPPAREGASRPDVIPRLNNYELLKRIGEGGMGLVYAGRKRDAVVDYRVAVKTILAAHFPSAAAVAHFCSEMRALEHLQHPNIVPILDCGQSDDGRPFFVMPHARCSLADVLEERGRLAPREAAEAVLTITRAVQYLHDKMVVHRDLKPRNILVDDSGRLWVADFGLAGLLAGDPQKSPSRPGEGTTLYMSPEQAEGRELESLDAGRQSDVWSLGVILYELLTGRRPFQGKGRAEIRLKILRDEPPAPRQLRRDIPRDLQRIVLKCLEKAPEGRYRSASDLADDLDRFLRREPPVHATPGSRWERLDRWARREPSLATRLAVAVGCSAIMWLHAIAPIVGLHSPDSPRVERSPYLDPSGLRSVNQGLLVLWILGSWAFQRLSDRADWTGWARRGWLTTDILVLATLIQISGGLMSPLPVAFAVLIVASGLWSHVPTVVSTTATAVAAYTALLVIDLSINGGRSLHPLRYHQYYLLALVVLGAIVVSQVRRVQALNRLYEQRPRL